MTAITATPIPTTAEPRTERLPVWRAGAVAGVAAAAATTAVALAAKAVDVPMVAAPKSADAGRAIPMNGFAMSTLGCTVVGILIAVALDRWARHPARTFALVATALTVVSFAGPVTTGHATTATRLVLALTHVVAAAIVIPVLTARLAEREGR
jgi:hypothetical protein